MLHLYRVFLLLLVGFALAGPSSKGPPNRVPPGQIKMEICHCQDNGVNTQEPFKCETLTVSEAGWLNGHLGGAAGSRHQFDCDHACPCSGPGECANNNAPSVVCEAPSIWPAGEEILFNCSGSSDPDGDALGFEFSLGDGMVVTTEDGQLVYIYEFAGDYDASVRVCDVRGGVKCACADVPLPVRILGDVNEECFDGTFSCADSFCEGESVPFYTGPAGTDGQASCNAGLKTCVGGQEVVTAPEVLPCGCPSPYDPQTCGCSETTFGCDGIDNDCNGEIDEGVVGPTTYCLDADNDGYGAPGTETNVCPAQLPPAYVADCTDCDDGDADTHPGAPEQCNNKDNDCDGQATQKSTFCLDADGDGFPDCNTCVESCSGFEPAGYIFYAGNPAVCDCLDIDPLVFPGQVEQCNGFDDDCDGVVDDGFDLNTDPLNCGACGTDCTTTGQQCGNGECFTPVSCQCSGQCPSEFYCSGGSFGECLPKNCPPAEQCSYNPYTGVATPVVFGKTCQHGCVVDIECTSDADCGGPSPTCHHHLCVPEDQVGGGTEEACGLIEIGSTGRYDVEDCDAGPCCDPAANSCGTGFCGGACLEGLEQCGCDCVDKVTDPLNCGGCGHVCAAGTECSGSECVPIPGYCVENTDCPYNSSCCGNFCPSTDCLSNEFVVNIRCGECGNTACTNILSNNNNCGTCGNACASGDTCQSGVCAPPSSCTDGIQNGDETGVDCGGSCPNACSCTVNTDCPSDECCDVDTCNPTGISTTACPTSLDCRTCTNDAADCKDGNTDPNNCGACGHVCATGESCSGGTCTSTCTPTTCAAEGATCLSIPDGCGGTLDCGACQDWELCTSSNQCAPRPCPPTDCGALDCSLPPGTCCGQYSNVLEPIPEVSIPCPDGNTLCDATCEQRCIDFTKPQTCGSGCDDFVNCNDNNECTVETCELMGFGSQQTRGCVSTPVTDTTPCGAGGMCQAGECIIPPPPDDPFVCPAPLSEVVAEYTTLGANAHAMPQDAVNAELWKAVGGGGIGCYRKVTPILNEADGGGGAGRSIYRMPLGDVSGQLFSVFIPKGGYFNQTTEGCFMAEDFVLYNSNGGADVEIIRAAGGANGGSFEVLTIGLDNFPSSITQAPGGEGALNRAGATGTTPAQDGIAGPSYFYEGGGGGAAGYLGPCSECPDGTLSLEPSTGGDGPLLPDGTQQLSQGTLNVIPSGGSSAYGIGSPKSCLEEVGLLHQPCSFGPGYGWGGVVEGRFIGSFALTRLTSSAGPGMAVLRYCSACGNGVLDAGEQCDDSNAENGDGCDSACQIE